MISSTVSLSCEHKSVVKMYLGVHVQDSMPLNQNIRFFCQHFQPLNLKTF